MSESVSAVLSCFNHAQYVGEAVESMLQQTLAPYEIIVVDDGSSDGSLQVLQAFGERIRLLTHPGHANRGSADSMNLGAAAARGDLIAFLESDDYWYPDKLRQQVEFLRAHPEIDLVYTNGHAVDQAGTRLWDLFPPGFVEQNRPEALLMNCYISAGMSTVVLRRQVFEAAGGFDTAVRYAKDHDLWLRLIERTRFAYIPEPLMAYRRHPGQQSAHRAHWDDSFTVLERAMKRYPYPASIRRQRLAVLHYRIAQCLWRSGSPVGAAGRAARAASLDPIRSIEELLASILGKGRS
ncbi:MAG: glycosyltransferase [Acidobacteria bacterium]|nr:glycosyltransferase [Acidobacteriota bacterium]